ncbi:phosphatase PAP2 family protein [Mumia sp. zg.B53]|uniref:phosphatase PAP2 family protein n=1 Tax=Mumia sp. zg.B53 TaxID=2855449 RepID=UPI001C6F0332|nr:phosphatase PAP2 family protein [Mumia sp. zg.B53]MBW9215907.1 phosphatase PAP2 family protein [Mumia sp. zg.B53]
MVETATPPALRRTPTWVRILRWPYTFLVAFSIAVGGFTIWASYYLDLPMRDPEGFLGPAYVRLPMLGLLFIGGGLAVQAFLQTRSLRGLRSRVTTIVRTEWSWSRLIHAALGLIAFYISYVSYRNLKSFLPIVREEVLHDADLMKMDHWLFFGHYPALVLHDVLGTGFIALILSTIYVSYLMLTPVSLAAVLVLNKDLSLGAWYATALSLNWILGVGSYYLVPTLGPVFANQSLFADLPGDSGVAALQRSLAHARYDVLSDPWATEKIHGIAGFASLHVSVVLTACLFFAIIGINKWLMRGLWVYFTGTVLATIYFGWHYVADDIGGVVIAVLSIAIGAAVTGNWGYRKTRSRERKAQKAALHSSSV